MKLEDFIARIESYDLAKDQSLIAADLQRLAENRNLLSDHLLARLSGTLPEHFKDLYNAYAFTLYECERFMVRLVFWAPGDSVEEAETFIYGLIHSHDFGLFVAGYCGDGYETVMRSISGSLDLQPRVKPVFGEASRLKVARGTGYYMRPFRDVHLQLPPLTLSGSISLISYLPDQAHPLQAWCFDDDYVPKHAGLGAVERELYLTGMHILEEQIAV